MKGSSWESCGLPCACRGDGVLVASMKGSSWERCGRAEPARPPSMAQLALASMKGSSWESCGRNYIADGIVVRLNEGQLLGELRASGSRCSQRSGSGPQ